MKKIGVLGLTFSLLSATAVNAADIYVKGINISGLQRVEQETVLSYIDIQNNKNVSQEKLDEALKQLYATGLFTDVSFNVAGDNVLNIKVVENPIVNKRAFDGNDKTATRCWRPRFSSGPAQFIPGPRFRKTCSGFWRFISGPGGMLRWWNQRLSSAIRTGLI